MAAAAAMVAVLAIGSGAAAYAEAAPDQHSGGETPGGPPGDPGDVLGETITRGPAVGASRGSLPLTGGDILGLSALGIAAVGVGTAASLASRRRTVRSEA